MTDTKVRVTEALQQDVSLGRARLDSETRTKLDISPGDILEITGTKTTCAVAWRSHPDDQPGTIRMDNLTRKNAGIKLGDQVTVRKAEVKTAKRIVLNPAISQDQELRFSDDISTVARRSLTRRAITKEDIIIVPNITLFGNQIPFKVTGTDPNKGIVMITDDTIIDIRETPATKDSDPGQFISYENIGGLKDQLQSIRETMELPLKHPELFDAMGIDPPKGVLLHGPPGTGKTLIAKAVANEVGAHFQVVNGPEIMSKFYGSSEENLRKIFQAAEKNAPAIVFFDEIDAIASKRNDNGGEVENRVVSQLLTLMDGLNSRGKVLVIAATNRPDSLDEALRRGGRFDREIEIGVPSEEGRREILEIHTHNSPLAEAVNLDQLAKETHGFVGADLASLVREAAMGALRRYLPDIDLDEPVPAEILSEMQILDTDFDKAMNNVEPSALRSVAVQVPDMSWDQVGGLENVKQQLKEAVEWPLEKPEMFKRLGIQAPKGILLYGPPGTGKTLLAKAVANESGANFLSIKGPEIFSKWVGESEQAIRELFKKASQASPCVIFLDELDALAPMRGSSGDGSKVSENVVNQLLTCMDGLEKRGSHVIVIGATNRPDIIDTGLLRAGRFDRLIKVSAPDTEARKAILEVHTKDMPLAKGVKLDELAETTKGYVGADIENLCREAAIIALREDEDAERVNQAHFDEALRTVRSSISEEIVKYYDRLEQQISQTATKRVVTGASSAEFL